MLMNILKELNWVDISVLIILFRICYIALGNGLFLEFFKLLGTFLAVYLSLHYYFVLADYAVERMGIKSMSLEFLSFISFIALAILGYLVFRLLRGLFAKFIKIEPAAGLDKWGGFILGAARGFLTISLVIFILAISPVNYTLKSVKRSFSGKDLFNISYLAYGRLWSGVMSKFMSGEKFNTKAFEVQASLEE